MGGKRGSAADFSIGIDFVTTNTVVAVAGRVLLAAAVIVGAPSPMVLAIIVGLFDLIPQIGSTIAAFIVVTITLIAEGPLPAAILLIVILVYQQLENYLIQPAVIRQAALREAPG